MTDRKELMDEAYEALLITVGVVGLSMASKKLLGEKLTDAQSVKDIGKLAVGVTASTLLVKYMQNRKYLPVDPFKSS